VDLRIGSFYRNTDYDSIHNESTLFNNSQMDNTDDMIEMNAMQTENLYERKSKKVKKLPPATSKLYKPDRKNKLWLPEERKEDLENSMISLHSVEDSLAQKRFSKRNAHSANSNTRSNKTTISDEEFEKRRIVEDAEREKANYYFRNIFIQGSLLQSFIWIDSYINPRHVRGTLWFTNTVFIWYFAAVVFNNSKDPNKVPDFDRKTRELTYDEIWVSFIAPWAAMVFIYIFALIMRLSPERIRKTGTIRYLDYVMDEYRREHVLRYLMGYFILLCVNVMVFIYLIEFTSVHGWKTSWLWWNTGSLGFFINT